MLTCLFFFGVIIAGVIADGTAVYKSETFPAGDPRRCFTAGEKDLIRFEVLPGGGWDNLQNKPMGMVSHHSYSKCRTTDDGRFLIPDSVYIIPTKASKVDTYAELIAHWDNFTSTLSRGVNVHADLNLKNVGISGKFSDEYQSVKSHQHYDKAMTTRVQARYVRYVAKLQPGSALGDDFRARLRKIATHITLNRTDLARYESQLIIRDYGTHVITSVDAGAALVKIDQVNEDYVRNYASKKNQILASASASFFSVFSFGVDYSQSTSKTSVTEYNKQLSKSKIESFGGPIFRPNNFTANQWTEDIDNNMVGLDKSGDPIYYVINDVTLPDVSPYTTNEVYSYVKAAVDQYYEHNTYRGCTRQDSPNFSFQANVDDGSCKAPNTNYTFGGVYQSCRGNGYTNLCSSVQQKNPLTGDYSCPADYEPILLKTGTKSSSTHQHSCHSCYLFFHCCKDKTLYASARYEAYWCAAKSQVSQNHGFLFGGIYNPMINNPLTQSQSCPPKFYPLRLLDNLVVCVSDDYELGYQYSVGFAGFFSCVSGNPLALREEQELLKSSGHTSVLMNYMMESGPSSYPHGCPRGYSQHLAIVDNSCEINYCVKSGSLSVQGLPKIQRPPFMEAPKDGLTSLEDAEGFVISDDGTLWTSMEEAGRNVPLYMKEHGMAFPKNGADIKPDATPNDSKSTSGSSAGMTTGGIVALSVFCTLLVVGLVAVGRLVAKRRTRLYRHSPSYDEQ